MKYRIFNLLILFSIVNVAFAELKLPAIVSSNMVLQRNVEVNIWGWTDAKQKVEIACSWQNEVITVRADSDGRWATTVKTTSTLDAQTMTISDKDSEVKLENILFGEVWICSGQSNMGMTVKGNFAQPTFGYLEALKKANNPNLRLFTVDNCYANKPQDQVEKYQAWAEATTENVPNFSAVAYFYAQQLQEILQVPVGVVNTSWGGTAVQLWMSQEALQEVEEPLVVESQQAHKHPSYLFNAMINPLIPYTFKGALWYQGEANRWQAERYETLLPAMVRDWRARWGQGDFPFYFVQIAPFNYGGNKATSAAQNTAFMRESMVKCKDLIPNSGIAITLDIGEATFIHPHRKVEVADRLLYNALSQTYGMPEFDGKSPEYESHKVVEGKIIVTFKNAENGLFAYDSVSDFEIAGEDKVFYPATVKINRRQSSVEVQSKKVIKPVAVRYAWRNFVVGTLFDANLLPATSFRTDDWDDATVYSE